MIASRGLVMLGLLGIAVASLGIPLAQPIAAGPAKDRSKPFPCQNRPCGCMSAEQCMRSCCCFSAEYRLAWAAKYQLAVPPELLAAEHDQQHCHDDHVADDDVADDDEAGAQEQAAACCAKPTGINPPAAACAKCEAQPVDCQDAVADQAEQQGWKVVVVIGSLASHCRGLGPHSLLTFSALPTLPAVSYHFDWCPMGWLLPSLASAASPSFAPPTHPPCA